MVPGGGAGGGGVVAGVGAGVRYPLKIFNR